MAVAMRNPHTAAIVPPKTEVAKGPRTAMPLRRIAFSSEDAARDFVLDRFQEMVDSGLASWWLNEDGRTELHLSSGEAFLVQDHGVLCLRE